MCRQINHSQKCVTPFTFHSPELKLNTSQLLVMDRFPAHELPARLPRRTPLLARRRAAQRRALRAPRPGRRRRRCSRPGAPTLLHRGAFNNTTHHRLKHQRVLQRICHNTCHATDARVPTNPREPGIKEQRGGRRDDDACARRAPRAAPAVVASGARPHDALDARCGCGWCVAPGD